VVAIAQSIPAADWQRLAFTLAETGWIWYEWVACRIQMTNDAVGEQWLLIRRTLTATPDYDFFVSNAPEDTSVTELARVASMRHEMEPALEEAKDQLGLADYEVRTWHGWHRHMTLCFLAHTWLTLMRMTEPEKKPLPRWLSFSLAEWRCLFNLILPLPQLGQTFRLRWFWWRRKQRLRAAASRLQLDVHLLLQLALPP
jgi:hypothetical protein